MYLLSLSVFAKIVLLTMNICIMIEVFRGKARFYWIKCISLKSHLFFIKKGL